MAIPSDSAQAKEVTGDIQTVQTALSKAITQVSGKFLGGEAADHVVATLNGMRPNIDAWAQRGTDALAAHTAPESGWAGWTAAGKIYIDGINDLTDLGLNATLQAVEDTIADAPATTVAATKATVKSVKKTVKAAAKTIVDDTHAAVHAVTSAVAAVPGYTFKLAIGIGLVAVAARYLLRSAR